MNIFKLKNKRSKPKILYTVKTKIVELNKPSRNGLIISSETLNKIIKSTPNMKTQTFIFEEPKMEIKKFSNVGIVFLK